MKEQGGGGREEGGGGRGAEEKSGIHVTNVQPSVRLPSVELLCTKSVTRSLTRQYNVSRPTDQVDA